MNRSKLIPHKWNLTVRTKLAALITVLIGGISLFIFVYFPARLENQAIRGLMNKAESIAEMTAFNISPALFFEDLEAAEKAFEGAKENQDLIYIMVFNSSGQVFASLNRDEADRANFNQIEDNLHTSQDGMVYRTRTPILNINQEIGQLYLGLSLEELKTEVARSRATIAILSFIIFVTGMIAVFGISTLITGPLSQMVETVKKIEKGDLTQRAVISSQDEVGHLARSFNLMVEHVEERTEELQQEIQERKRAEEALRESEERLQYILAASPAIIYSCKVNYNGSSKENLSPSFVSENITNVMGYETVECLSNPEWWNNYVHPEDTPRISVGLRRLFEQDHCTHEYRFRHKDGTYRWVHDKLKLIRDSEGNPLDVIGSWIDITERVQAEQARALAEQELEEQKALSMRSDRLRSLGEMAAGIAHELNQPLVGVRGLAEHTLIGMGRGWDLSEDKLRDRLTRIVDQADRMVHIIQHVRMFAREAGEPDLESVQVNDVVGSGIDMLGAQFRSHGIDLNSDLAQTLPQVSANPFSLEEVVLNLLSNARDAVEARMETDGSTCPAWVMVKTGMTEKGGGQNVEIEVVDTGMGIPQEILAKIFDPFFTTKDPDKGTGLGLSVSRTIVEEIDGTIRVLSTPGEGTTVTLSLPAEKQPIQEAQ